jgi:hypothetical protein
MYSSLKRVVFNVVRAGREKINSGFFALMLIFAFIHVTQNAEERDKHWHLTNGHFPRENARAA